MDAFPAFFPLTGRTVVVAGIGEGADAKVRLFAGSPARIARIAPEQAGDPAAYAGAVLAFSYAMLEVSDSMILALDRRFYPITKVIYTLFGRIGDGEGVVLAEIDRAYQARVRRELPCLEHARLR